MKKAFLLIIAVVVVSAQSRDFALLWIGNSLMQGAPGCESEGWAWVGDMMINPDSVTLGMTVSSAAVKRGATDIPEQWKADSTAGNGACTGVGEINQPTGCNLDGSNPQKARIAARDNYDYVVLQGYHWGSVYDSYAAALKYSQLYCDQAVSRGTAPIFFCCWQQPGWGTPDSVIACYDSLFHKYRRYGAILAPIFQAHRLVWNDPAKNAATYLYNAGDAYHHENLVGSWLNMCVFYEVFTGKSAVGKTMADFKPYCYPWVSPGLLDSLKQVDIDYCANKAHQAVVNYYGAGNIPHLGISAVSTMAPLTSRLVTSRIGTTNLRAYDLTGRNMPARIMHSRNCQVIIGVDGSRAAQKVVINRQPDKHS